VKKATNNLPKILSSQSKKTTPSPRDVIGVKFE